VVFHGQLNKMYILYSQNASATPDTKQKSNKILWFTAGLDEDCKVKQTILFAEKCSCLVLLGK